MKRPSVQRSIRLDPVQFDRLTEIASAQQRSLADVLRMAVDHYLSGARQVTENEIRLHRISEFSQIALDLIIRQEYPEMLDALLGEMNRRMERFHGTR